MICCDKCFDWFHFSCVKSVPQRLVSSDYMYRFQCRNCARDGTERFEYLPKRVEQLMEIVMVRALRAGLRTCLASNSSASFTAPPTQRTPRLCAR